MGVKRPVRCPDLVHVVSSLVLCLFAISMGISGCGTSSSTQYPTKTVNKLSINMQSGSNPIRIAGIVDNVQKTSSGLFINVKTTSIQVILLNDNKSQRLTGGIEVVCEVKDLKANPHKGDGIVATGQVTRATDGFKIVLDRYKKL